jgi:hypothetical protein
MQKPNIKDILNQICHRRRLGKSSSYLVYHGSYYLGTVEKAGQLWVWHTNDYNNSDVFETRREATEALIKHLCGLLAYLIKSLCGK